MDKVTFVVTCIGLPDCQYKDYTVWAVNKYEAMAEADKLTLADYGHDDFDIIESKEPDFT